MIIILMIVITMILMILIMIILMIILIMIMIMIMMMMMMMMMMIMIIMIVMIVIMISIVWTPLHLPEVYQLLVVACGGADSVVMRSCDESSLQVSGFSALLWAGAVRRAVRAQTRCACSVGIGPSQVVAKLAVKAAKPDGARRVADHEVLEFLEDLPTSELPQVGRKMAAQLLERGLRTCRDVLAQDKGQLRQWFGVRGEMVWAYARGEDFGSGPPAARQSMSAQMTWGIRVQDRPGALKILTEVAQQLSERLARSGSLAAHVTLKLMIAVPGWEEPMKKGGHGMCESVTRSALLSSASHEAPALYRCALQLFDAVAPPPARLRGVGLAARLGEASGTERSGLSRWLRAPAKGGAAAAARPEEARAEETELDDSDGDSGAEAWAPEARAPCGAGRRGLPAASARNGPPTPSAAVIDLDDPDDPDDGAAPARGVADGTVACPVCGALQRIADAEAHVNGHFEAAAAAAPAHIIVIFIVIHYYYYYYYRYYYLLLFNV